MTAAEPREGDPRFDLLSAVQAALLPYVAATEAAGDPSLDATLYEPPEHAQHHEGCDCAACVAYVAEIDVIVDDLRAQAITYQTDRALVGLDAVAYDPCPLALMARGGEGVAERRGARYARTPRAARLAEEPAVAVLRLRARHRPLVAADVVLAVRGVR